LKAVECASSRMRIGGNCGSRIFENSDGQFSADCREVVKKHIDRISSLQVFEQDPNRDPGSRKHGRSTHEFRVTDDRRMIHWLLLQPKTGL
jgi:hypothetical protein